MPFLFLSQCRTDQIRHFFVDEFERFSYDSFLVYFG